MELWKGDHRTTTAAVASTHHQSPPFKHVRVMPGYGGDRLSTLIGGLEAFGHYNLTALCYTGGGDGPRSEPPVAVVTAEDLPGAVAALSFDAVMFDSVRVEWEPPARPNGRLLKYTLRWWETTAADDAKAEGNSSTTNTTTTTMGYERDLHLYTVFNMEKEIFTSINSANSAQISRVVAKIWPRLEKTTTVAAQSKFVVELT